MCKRDERRGMNHVPKNVDEGEWKRAAEGERRRK